MGVYGCARSWKPGILSSSVQMPEGKSFVKNHWGDGVAQLVEHWTQDPKTGGLNPACVRSTRTSCEILSKKCADWLSVCPTPVCKDPALSEFGGL